MKPKALVYKPELLPYSETFIKEQMLAYQAWQGVLVGHQRIPHGLSLEGLNLRFLLNDPPSASELYIWRLRRWLGVPSKREITILAEEKAQLFHAHFGTAAVDIWPTVRTLNIPMVVTLHGYDINIYRDWWESGRGGLRRRSYPKKLLALAEQPRVHFIAVSEAIQRRAIDYGIDEKKITIAHIGIDTTQFVPGESAISRRPKRVLYIGRLVEKKGVKYLIDAFGKVSRKHPDAELCIIGTGPLEAQLEAEARNYSSRISFLGAMNKQQIKQQLDQARMLCLPSIRAKSGDDEGFGLVLLEAQASGVPDRQIANG